MDKKESGRELFLYCNKTDQNDWRLKITTEAFFEHKKKGLEATPTP